jgi:hypothetical protein
MSGSNEHKLDELFVAYRESFPDREPSVNFTPELWRRIDQRRKVSFSMTRFARNLVTGALALCFVMTAMTWTTSSTSPSVYTATYVDVLDEEAQHEIVDVVGESL